MILPIVAFGHPVLKKMCKNITSDYENLDLLIDITFHLLEIYFQKI